MSLQQQFEQSLANLGIVPGRHRVLAAVSGGVDSMVLLSLLLSAGVETEVAHVNFGLRGGESDADQLLVQEYCDNRDIACHISSPETLAFAGLQHLSVQMAARELRYRFFDDLLSARQLDFVLTAHQAQDNLEHFFIYLSRNNVQTAFRGIPATTGRVRRPLLFASREAIELHAGEQLIPFRTDASNLSDKYLRNRIRHHIIPCVMQEWPEVLETFAALSADYAVHLQQGVAKFSELLALFTTQTANNGIRLSREILSRPNGRAAFRHWCRSFGFHPHVIANIENAQTGRRFDADGVQLLADREGWTILNSEMEMPEYEMAGPVQLPLWVDFGNIQLHLYLSHKAEFAKNRFVFDAAAIAWPLRLRSWKTGDRMQPFGMQGSKKLSDLFVDAKLNATEKQQVSVLTDENGILGAVPLRQSEHARVTQHTEHVLVVEWEGEV